MLQLKRWDRTSECSTFYFSLNCFEDWSDDCGNQEWRNEERRRGTWRGPIWKGFFSLCYFQFFAKVY